MSKAGKGSRKLKVYQAQFGFHDSVVAAPNQAAALRAWGVHQNLFVDGGASISTDAAAIDAAMAHPDVPLRRAVGSTDAFSLAPKLPIVPDAPRAQSAAQGKRAKPKPMPPADRSALSAAESVLTTLTMKEEREKADLLGRRAALDAECEAAEARWHGERTRAEKALKQERTAYRKAGGKDG